ncbi:MAG: (d)CMP kinase [Elusimicrobiales bacterium]|nr:(d)CMP kinase [Elusimicrobiales bacterium]
MRAKGIIIAIDGPAGVGKSSIGEMLALRLDYKFISTGKMYRALTWKANENGLDLSNETEIMNLADNIGWDFKSDENPLIKIIVDGIIMGKQITDEKVGKATSAIAKLPQVRRFMCAMQREIGRDGGIVLEGRDIGSNVFPDAELKIYLDASPDERAQRRVKQLAEQNFEADYEQIYSLILKRDKQDAERKHNPLKQSDSYHYVDSTKLNKEDVVNKIFQLYEKRVKP